MTSQFRAPRQLALTARADGKGDSDGAPEGPAQQRLTGTLQRVVYQHPESHYTVARLTLSEPQPEAAGDDVVTVVGTLSDLYDGMPLEIQLGL